MQRLFWAVCFFSVTSIATQLVGQVNPYNDPTPGVSDYRGEVLAEVRIQEDKFLRLAEAIPADKYTWRPGEGVRSIAEVFLHVSAANYNLPKLIGTPPPHSRKAIMDMPDADLSKRLDCANESFRVAMTFALATPFSNEPKIRFAVFSRFRKRGELYAFCAPWSVSLSRLIVTF